MLLLFFFQAEDGIRDLVRSRGLGDVYKRQDEPVQRERLLEDHGPVRREAAAQRGGRGGSDSGAVSYTHLTLPTSDLV